MSWVKVLTGVAGAGDQERHNTSADVQEQRCSSIRCGGCCGIGTVRHNPLGKVLKALVDLVTKWSPH